MLGKYFFPLNSIIKRLSCLLTDTSFLLKIVLYTVLSTVSIWIPDSHLAHWGLKDHPHPKGTELTLSPTDLYYVFTMCQLLLLMLRRWHPIFWGFLFQWEEMATNAQVCNTLVGECQDQPGTAGREQEAATVGAMLEQILKGQEVLQVAFWEEHPKEVLHWVCSWRAQGQGQTWKTSWAAQLTGTLSWITMR